MLYFYNKHELRYRKATPGILSGVFIIFIISGLLGFTSTKQSGNTYITERRIYTENDTLVLSDFNETAYIAYMKDLNIRFPHIVYAQSIVETGEFSSDIFHMNNNLFGMKRARLRCTIARGTQRGHAYYEHWSESVIDYAFYQTTYLHKIRTEEDYFAYLAENYAEDPNYVSKLKKCIDQYGIIALIDKV
jgi:hypothetical protein